MEDENKLSLLLSQYKLPLAMGLVGTVLLISGVASSGIIPKTFLKNSNASVKSAQAILGNSISTKVAVDVSGAVNNPGLYYLPADLRVEEAVRSAGGVTEAADPFYVSKSLNLAQKLSDGMKIYIPFAGEAGMPGGEAGSSAVPGNSISNEVNSLININNASLAQLISLPKVGTTRAQSIIDNRPYDSVEELLTKKAIPRDVYNEIKDQVNVW